MRRSLRVRFQWCGAAKMRFGERPPPDVDTRPVDPSLRAVPLPPDYTPYPLPKVDSVLEFGPTRISHIPDIAKARARVQVAEAEVAANTAVAAAAILQDDAVEKTSIPLAGQGDATAAELDAAGRAVALPPYVRDAGFPLIDRLTCTRSLPDLLRQFTDDHGDVRKAAAISDLAAGLPRWTNEELTLLFDTLADQFDPDGRGLNFIARLAPGYMLPVAVSSCVHHAFVHLIESIDKYLLETDLRVLRQDPTLMISMLRTYAKFKIFQPNLWLSATGAMQTVNTATGLQPKGHNRHYFLREHFVEVFDRLNDLLVSVGDATEERGAGSQGHQPFLSRFHVAQLAELFAALVAVDPKGRVDGRVTTEVLQHFLYDVQRRRELAGEHPDHDLDVAIGRIAIAATMSGITYQPLNDVCDACRFLSEELLIALSRRRPLPTVLAKNRIRDAVKQSSSSVNEVERLDLLRGAQELLMALPPSEDPVSLCEEQKVFEEVLKCIPQLNGVLQGLTQPGALQRTRQPRVLTYRNSLAHLNRMSCATIFHSSSAVKDLTPLIDTVRHLRSGKHALLVSCQSLLALHRYATSSATKRTRERAKKALDIIGSVGAKGRIMFVPLADELAIRAGQTFVDEDVVLWALVFRMLRDVPLVKPRVMVDRLHEASAPHRFLKRGSYVDFTIRPHELHLGRDHRDGPPVVDFSSKELSVLVRKPQFSKKIRDRKSTVREYSLVRSRLAFRRDKALFDKYYVPGRNLLQGFPAGGATKEDLRNLGIHTPDHHQVTQ